MKNMQSTKKGQANSKKNDNKKTIDLDNEVIIGLNTENKSEPKIQNNKKRKKKSIKKKNKTKNNGNKKKKKLNPKVKKVLILSVLILVGIMLILLSSIFNCKEIQVIGNSKVSTDEIISLSNIKTEENMFKINVFKARKNIKENAYINNVKIKRKLHGKVEIIVEERFPTFILSCEEGCILINNQGYILEQVTEPPKLPTIIGINTDFTIKNNGDRLDNADLVTLEKIILITDIAEKKELKNLITYINISNTKDIVIYMDSQKKTIHFGDETNASKKFDRVKTVMENETNYEGEIFVQDIENVYFREKV